MRKDFVIRCVLCLCLLIASKPVLADDSECKNWTQIQPTVEKNLQFLSDNFDQLPIQDRSGSLKYPVVLYSLDLPKEVYDFYSNLLIRLSREANLKFTNDNQIGGSSLDLIWIKRGEPAQLSTEIGYVILNSIRRFGFNVNEGDVAAPVAQMYEFALQNIISHQFVSNLMSAMKSGNLHGSDIDIFRFVFIRKDTNTLMTASDKRVLAGSMLAALGVPPIPNFNYSIFSAGSNLTEPTDVDIAMIKIISHSEDLRHWRSGMELAFSGCKN